MLDFFFKIDYDILIIFQNDIFLRIFTKMATLENSFKEITLFEIPDWLKTSEFASPLFKEIEYYKTGTQEWFNHMLEKIFVKMIPPKTDNITNIEEFKLIMEASDFFGYKDSNGLDMKYPLSVYAYVFTHIDEVKKYLIEEYQYLSTFDDSDVQDQKQLSSVNFSSNEFRMIDFFNDINNNTTIYKYRKLFHDYLVKYFLEFKDEISTLSEEFVFDYEYYDDEIDIDENGYQSIHISNVKLLIYKDKHQIMSGNISLEFLLYLLIIQQKNNMVEEDYDLTVDISYKISYNNDIISLLLEGCEIRINIDNLNIKESLNNAVDLLKHVQNEYDHDLGETYYRINEELEHFGIPQFLEENGIRNYIA